MLVIIENPSFQPGLGEGLEAAGGTNEMCDKPRGSGQLSVRHHPDSDLADLLVEVGCWLIRSCCLRYIDMGVHTTIPERMGFINFFVEH